MWSPNSRVSAFFASASAVFFCPISAPISFDDAVALRFERFDFRQNFPPLLVELEQFINLCFIPCPARGEPLAHKIRLFANQFDVEHVGIIEVKPAKAKSVVC